MGIGFGRKKSGGIPAHPGPDPDGVSRLLPQSVFDGPAGAFLERIGFSADDPANLMPSQQLLQARFDASRGDQKRFVAKVNASIGPDMTVAPYAMLPWSLWRDARFAGFLSVTCEVFPTHPYLTMLLPETEMGSAILDLPVHPRGYPRALEEAAEVALADLKAQVERRQTEIRKGGLDDFYAVSDKWKELCAFRATALVTMGRHFAKVTFGEPAMARHMALWGKTLAWPDA